MIISNNQAITDIIGVTKMPGHKSRKIRSRLEQALENYDSVHIE